MLGLLGPALLGLSVLVTAGPERAAADQQAAACGYHLEDILADRVRSQLGVPQVWRNMEARIVLAQRPGDAIVRSAVRNLDVIFADPADGRAIAIESTVGSLDKKMKRAQLLKDASLIRYGGTYTATGTVIPAGVMKVVWVLPYTPSAAKAQEMTGAGIMYYNYLNGETNIDALPLAARPSVAVMRTVLRPAQLDAFRRQMEQLEEQEDPGLVGAIAGLLTIYNIVADIRDATWHASIAAERQAGIAAAITELRHEYPAGQTFWVEVTQGSDMAGPYAEYYGATGCLPTLTYARVVELGPANPPCRVGSMYDVSRPVMTAQGMPDRFQMFNLCVKGSGEAAPPAAGGYNECEALGDPMCGH
jgi:hypothetical protein